LHKIKTLKYQFINLGKKYKAGSFYVAGDEMIGCAYGTILEKRGKTAVIKNDYYALDQDHHSLAITNDHGKIHFINPT
jgi:hypothetical protein